MSTPISKRQQARNERQLQDLIHTVPGNDRCADCAAKNPGWASWNLGIFLCVRCASLHRKLGTHVSKVKSLSMDSWSTEQVDNMKKVGNVRSNATYNPQNTRADIPIDADEVDSAMERFIRRKYESKTLSTTKPAARQDTGSTGSWSDEPPPLPPKPKKFLFNLRSASSASHQQPRQDRFTPPLSPVSPGSDTNKISKPSQVFGMKITSVGNNFDQKLAMLRDMGFGDNERNTEILKSSNGNVDKAVETLIRLGEGAKPISGTAAPAPRTLTPVSIDKTRQSEARASTNPWEVREASPQRSVSQPVLQASPPPRSQSAGPTSNSWNPFLSDTQPDQSIQGLQDSFQTLQMSQTGPISQQPSLVQQIPNVPPIPQQYQNQAFPPQQQMYSSPWQMPPSQLPQPYQATGSPFSQPQTFQQQSQPQQPQATGSTPFGQPHNPFLQSSTLQSAPPSNPWGLQTAQSPASISQQSSPWTSQPHTPAPVVPQSTNPFGPLPTAPTWPPQNQNFFSQSASESPAPMAGQQAYFVQQQPQQQQPQQTQTFAPNPWQQQPPQPQQQFQQPSPFNPQQQQQIRHDKSSILALYNMPHLAPRQPLQTLQEDPNAAASLHTSQGFAPQRSATMPLSSSSAFPQSAQPIRHVSNESVDFIGLGGRQSPDAFAGLSAQYMR